MEWDCTLFRVKRYTTTGQVNHHCIYSICRGSNGDRSKCGPAPRPAKDGYTVEALKEAGSMLLRKCPDIYPCARLALQVAYILM